MKSNLTALGVVKRISGNEMTHDELMVKIEASDDNLNFYALRAVVELHNQGNTGECGDEDCCGGFTPDICGYCHDEYPCPTIQAIEKELG